MPIFIFFNEINFRFKNIYDNSVWIAKQNDSPDYLNIDKYNLLEKEKKEIATKTRELLKLKTDLDIKILETIKNDSLNVTTKERSKNNVASATNVKSKSNNPPFKKKVTEKLI